jgi:hypothetical protein
MIFRYIFKEVAFV